MERMVEKGESWLSKEQARLVTRRHAHPDLHYFRIAGLLASPSLAPKKLDELRVKSNILSSFVMGKVADTYEAAQDMAGDALNAAQGLAGDAKGKAGEAVDAARDAAAQAAEGADAFVDMMEGRTGMKVKGEL